MMAEIVMSFTAADAVELRRMIEAWIVVQPPSTQAERETAGFVEAPSSPELLEDADTLTNEEYDAKHDPKSNGAGKPEPEPAHDPTNPFQPRERPGEAPAPAKRARAARAPRVSAPAPQEPAAPAPAPPEPAAPPPPVDLPPLDTLKAVITSAVRLAQKGEGSKKILDLLPAFKDTTGLAFVMNAEDKHRVALYDLVQAAGLPVV
jgi:hypothetical protein